MYGGLPQKPDLVYTDLTYFWPIGGTSKRLVVAEPLLIHIWQYAPQVLLDLLQQVNFPLVPPSLRELRELAERRREEGENPAPPSDP